MTIDVASLEYHGHTTTPASTILCGWHGVRGIWRCMQHCQGKVGGLRQVDHPESQNLAIPAAEGSQGHNILIAGAVELPDGCQLGVQRQSILTLGAPMHIDARQHIQSPLRHSPLLRCVELCMWKLHTSV